MSSADNQNNDEMDLGRLLGVVSSKGLKALDLAELERLRTLLEAKSYVDRRASKSKAKLLKQINGAFYDRQTRHRLF